VLPSSIKGLQDAAMSSAGTAIDTAARQIGCVSCRCCQQQLEQQQLSSDAYSMSMRMCVVGSCASSCRRLLSNSQCCFAPACQCIVLRPQDLCFCLHCPFQCKLRMQTRADESEGGSELATELGIYKLPTMMFCGERLSFLKTATYSLTSCKQQCSSASCKQGHTA
jgi:hypothetical protein